LSCEIELCKAMHRNYAKTLFKNKRGREPTEEELKKFMEKVYWAGKDVE